MFFVPLLYLSGSDRAILVYFIVNILRFAGQFKISQIGSHIQVIQVIEYLFAFIAVLYFPARPRPHFLPSMPSVPAIRLFRQLPA